MATDHNFRIKNGLEVGGQLIVTSSGQLAVAAVSSQLQFLDNVKAKFGNGSDLQIYHESSTSNSYISEGGAGNLYISANNLRLTNYGITESYLQADANGAVTLYYDGSAKFATTSSGVDITGNVVADGGTIDGDFNISGNVGIGVTDPATRLEVKHDSNASTGITVENTSTGTGARAMVEFKSDAAQLNAYATGSNYSGVTSWPDAGVLSTSSSSSGGLILNAQAGGVKFQYGTTERMRVHTNGNIGINETTPLAKLEVAGAIKATSRDTSHTSEAGLTISYDTSNNIGLIETWTSKPLLTRTYNYQAFDISGTEKMRINTTGVGIGTNNPAQLLTVEGGAEAIGLNLTGSGSRLTIGSDGTYNYFRAKSGNQFKFTTTGGSDLLLNNSGVLTLSAGTSNRTVQLHDDGLYISRTTDGAYTSKVVSDSTNTNNLAVYARSYINFYHNAAKRFSFTDSGTLGIDEASPNYTIHAKKDMASSPSNIIYLEMSGTNADGGGGAIRFDTSASSTTETAYWAGIEGIRSGTSDGSNELKFYTASAATNSGAPSVKMTIDKDGNTAIGNSVDTTRLRVTGSTNDSSADALKVEDSNGNDLLRVVNDGRVLVSDNYFYVNSSQGAYFDGSIKARGGINNDQGDLTLSDNVNVTGQLQVYNGSSTNRIRLYTETGTAQIADTLSDTTTQKSYIYFDAGSSSNDPGYIMHETSDSETNEGIIHLVPSDDNQATDYVSIHGTNDPDCLRLTTYGKIETAGGYQLTLVSGTGDVLVDDGLTVSNNLTVTGDLVVNGSTTTFNTATLDVEDKNITLNYGSGDTSATANGAGITIQDAVNSTTDATILWDATNDEFDISHPVKIAGSIGVTNIVTNKVVKFNGSVLDDSNITDTGSAITLGSNTTVSGTLSTGEATTFHENGFAISDAYYAWKRSYSVSNTSTKEILDRDGNSLNTAGVYRLTAHISGTGTDNNTTAVVWNQNGTWRINVTGQSGQGSNHPEFIIDGTANKPYIRFDHTSTYTVIVYHEWMRLNEESGGTDNSGYAFGADGYMSSVGDVLRYDPLGSTSTGVDPYTSGYTVWHSNNSQQFTTTLKNKLDGIESNATADQTAADIRGLGFFDTSNDGSGSGFDADLLDGQHGSHYLNYNNFTNTPTIPTVGNGTIYINTAGSVSGGGNFTVNQSGNSTLTITGNGIMQGTHAVANSSFSNTNPGGGFRFQRVTGGTNRFTGSHHNLLQIPNTSGDNYLAQIAFETGSTGLGWRNKGTSWSDWYTIWHSGNDGASSGLDADLLDGQHGSHYLNYNNFTNTPTIPTNNNQLTNGAGYITSFDITTQTDPKYLRSDTADTATGDINFARASFGSSSLHTTGGTHGVVTDSFSIHSGGSDLMYMRPSALRSDNGFFQWQTYNGGNGGDIELQPYGGSITISTGSSSTSSDRGLRFQTGSGNYSDGRWQHRFRKQDKGGGIPLYIDVSTATANSFSELARFGTYTGNSYEFEVQGDINATGNLYDGGNAVWHAGNDGSGSGLDADTLDGVRGASYLRSDTSDTFTGTLTMAGALNMGNQQIYNCNNLRFGDPGVNEGIKWDGGNEWQIYESPDNQTNASGNLQFTSGSGNGTIRMTLDTSGNLNVTGTLTATAKSFDIEHPTKEGMRLHHGVLEGPEHAVYIRGKTKGSLIQLPEYWTGLIHEDTITVQLTPIGKSSELYVKDISDNKVLVSNDTEYFYFIQAERKDVERFEVEYGDDL